jgi:flagellar basal-body rod protein FlgF
MDKALYVSMNGAQATFDRMAHTSNNIANVATNGFRAALSSTKALYVDAKDGMPTRVFTQEADAGFRADAGAMQATGNPLDVAITGEGWFATQDAQGKEAYTRGGSLNLSSEGVLVGTSGRPMLGDGGPITVPQGSTDIAFGADGTVSVKQNGQRSEIGRLKLTNPAAREMARGADGLFRTKSGTPAALSPTTTMVSGMVEGSNVSVVEEMTHMIESQRRFDLQMKMMQAVEQNSGKASQILNLG